MDPFLADFDHATALAVLNALWDEFDAMAAGNRAGEQAQRAPEHVQNDRGRNRNNTVVDHVDDASISLQLQKQELGSHFVSLVDQLVARQLADEEDRAGVDILNNIANEIRAKSDSGRKLAERLFGVDIDLLVPPFSAAEAGEEVSGAEYLATLRTRLRHLTSIQSHDEDQTNNAGVRENNGDRNSHCVCCMVDFDAEDTVTCPCSHDYCRVCLRDFFCRSLTDESLFPPRCCNEPIPVEGDIIKDALGEDLVADFQDKKEEFEAPNRMYCHVQGCGAWISPRHIDISGVGTCPECQAKTCATCKAAVHEGMDCPEDEGTRNILNLAQQEGWRQCYSCHRVVELNTGCYHISKILKLPSLVPSHQHSWKGIG